MASIKIEQRKKYIVTLSKEEARILWLSMDTVENLNLDDGREESIARDIETKLGNAVHGWGDYDDDGEV